MFLDGIANLGTLSLGALIFYVFSRRAGPNFSSPLLGVVIGVSFGLLSVLVINMPLSIPMGASFDTRAGPTVLAGFFAGPIGAILCAVIAAAARYSMGGPAVIGGMLSPFVYAAVGTLAGHLMFRVWRRAPSLLDFLALALVASVAAVPCFFIGQSFDFGLMVLQKAWFVLMLGNIVGVVVLGVLTEEVRRALMAYTKNKHALLTSNLARQSAAIAVWQFDFKAERLVWDDAMFRLYDVDPAKFAGQFSDWSDCVAEVDRDHVCKDLFEASRTNGAFQARFRITRRDGSIRWIQAHCQFLKDDSGELVTALGVNWDITDIRTLEQSLREKEREARDRSTELEVTLASMNHGVGMFDRNGNLKYFNERLREVYGLSEEALQPKTHVSNVLAMLKSRGVFENSSDGNATYLRRRLSDGEIVRSRMFLSNGKVASIVFAPMPGGGWVETHEDITDKAVAEARVRSAAETDALTGLANRMAFNRALEAALRKTALGENGQALTLIDLNNFKSVNDTYGHPVGDRLLRRVAKVLAEHAGDGDLVVRLGGDEFAVLSTKISKADLRRFVRVVIAQLSEPQVLGDVVVSSGVSIGITTLKRTDRDMETVLAHADGALYKAKDSPSSNFRFFDNEIEAEILRRRRLKSDLAIALQNDQLEVFYQPIVSFLDRRLLGCEALARWRGADGKFIPPSEFIPIAEDAGMIADIGAYVLQTAIKAASAWPDPVTVAVNVSPRQLGSGAMVDTTLKLLSEYGLEPGRLELEVTENILMEPHKAAVEELQQLRAAGISIVLDDFGTGYSSLSYLHRFSFDKLKIDRSFVADMENDPACAAIVSTMANLAQSLGLSCTAEGIERESQMTQLRLAGCSHAQGFLIGKPMPVAELHRLWFDKTVTDIPSIALAGTPRRAT